MRYQTSEKRKLNIEEIPEGLILREDSLKLTIFSNVVNVLILEKTTTGHIQLYFWEKL